MATFDTLIDDLASRFGLGANARTLVKEVLTMISGAPGGLGGFLDKFKTAGLASEVASWLGRPDASSDRRRPNRTRARRDCARRDRGPPRPRAGRRVGRARIRLAEDRWPFDAGRRRSRRRPRGGHGFSLAAASRGGDGTGRAAAARRLSGERAEPVRRRALAMAGARRPGRRGLPCLFLVDQPDAVHAARRKGAGARDASALDRRCRRRPRPPAASAPRAAARGASARAPAAAQAQAPAALLRRKRRRRLLHRRRRPAPPARASPPPPQLRLRRTDCDRRRLQPRLPRRSRRLNQPRPRSAATPTRLALS